MSRTVDERIVSMQFDNSHFERNVRTSMSTLERLKQSLNLSGAAKGLDNIGEAARRCDMSGMSAGIDTVRMKFSGLQVMAVTALANITNSAVNAGRRMINAFTFEPLRTGFNEYELKMNSVQTIMASTGEKLETVNKYLEELNTYSDKTIYSFSDMTENIGKFTNAGVKLEDAVMAIKGISNEAAVSGANANEASRAMYNFAQALSAGHVKLIDWKSIELANMATVEFKEQLIETAVAAGTLAKGADGMYKVLSTNGEGGSFDQTISATKNFNESLNYQWMTTDVLIETLSKYADETTDIGKKAFSAAQDVKTFSMMMDTLKESMQSGWAKTWELLFGDYNEAKQLWTGLTNFFGGIIDKFNNSRNDLLEGALGSPFKSLQEKLEGLNDAAETIKEVKTNYDELVNSIIKGDWGNYTERYDKLTEAGYDWAYVQNLVNEKLGDSFRHETDYKEAQEESNKARVKSIEELTKLSTAQLESLGYTNEEIQALRLLSSQSYKTGIPIEELAKDLSQLSGRSLLLNGFKNIGESIVTVFKSMGTAWRNIFPATTSTQLYNAIAGFHKFTTYLTISDGTAKKLVRTFKGVFAALDIIRRIIGGGFTLAFEVAKTVLEMFDMDILDLTANIGDAIVKFRNWLKNCKIINKGVDLLATGVVKLIKGMKSLYDWFTDLPEVQEFVESIKEFAASIKDLDFSDIGAGIMNFFSKIDWAGILPRLWEKLKNVDLSEIGTNIVEGFKNGLQNGIESIPQMLIDLGNLILTTIKDILGIHSPSTEFFDIAWNCIVGFIDGIAAGIGYAGEKVKEFGLSILNMLKQIPWGSILAAGISIGIVFVLAKIAMAFGKIANAVVSLGDVIENFAGFVDSLRDGVNRLSKAVSFKLKSEALYTMAKALGVLVLSIIALSMIPGDALLKALGSMIILIAVLGALAFISTKMSEASVEFDYKKGFNVDGLKTSLMGLATAILLIGYTAKILGGMKPDELKQGLLSLAGIIVVLGVVAVGFGHIAKAGGTADVDKLGKMLSKMAIAMLLMVGVVKLAGNLSKDDMYPAIAFVTGFVAFVGGLALVTKNMNTDMTKLGGLMVKLSIAMALMVGVVKLASKLSQDELKNGAVFAAAFLAFIFGLTKISNASDGKEIKGLSRLLISISVSMLLMTGVVNLADSITVKEAGIAAGLALAFLGFITVLTKITTITSEQQTAKLAGIILSISVAIGILAMVCIMLGMVKTEHLIKGVAAVTILSVLVMGLIAVTKFGKDAVNLVGISIAIGVLAASVAALSFINPEKLFNATVALGALLGMLALVMKMSGNTVGAMGSIIAMSVMIAVITGSLMLLANVPNVLANVINTSLMLGVMAVICKTMSMVPFMAAINAALGLSAFVAIMAVVIAAFGAIGLIPGVDTLLQSGGDVLGLVGVAIGKFIGGILGGIAAGATSVLPQIGADLSAFMVAATPFIMLSKLVDESTIIGAGCLAAAIAALSLASFIEGITSLLPTAPSLPELGTQLSQFMVNALPFITLSRLIDETAVDAASKMADMIMTLTVADLLQSITSFITGAPSFENFGTQLTSFGKALVEFSGIVSGNINEEAVTAASNAGQLMVALAKELPGEGGLLQWIIGEKDLGSFGNQLVSFGKGIKAFSDSVSEGNGINVDAVSAAASAGDIMVALAKELPGEGGLLQWIMGEKNLSTFGVQLVSFGGAMTTFSNTLTEGGGINQEAVEGAAKAGDIMIALAKELPTTGGLIGWIMGEQNLETFGTQMVAFGEAIVDFSDKVAGNINTEAVEAAANAGTMMATLANSLPEDGSIWDIFTSDDKMNFDDFGKQLVKFAEGLVDFSNKLTESGFDSSVVTPAVTAADELVSLFNRMVDLDTSGAEEFKWGVSDLTYADVSGFAESFTPETVNSATSAIKKLVSTFKSMKNLDTSAVTTFKDALNSLTEIDLTDFIAKFNDSEFKMAAAGANMFTGLITGLNSKKSNVLRVINDTINTMIKLVKSKSKIFQTMGIELMTRLIAGITSRKVMLMASVTNSMLFAVMAIKMNYSSFESAGGYLGDGLVAGINSKQQAAYDAGYALGQKAVQGEKDGQASNSPSKLTIQSGKWLGEGLVIGIDKMGRSVYKAGYNMGEYATKSISSAVSRVVDVLDSDMDTQPTIRPVLDLSDVSSGVGLMNNMFGLNPSIGVMSNIGRISSMMNSNQNGANNDVISAIKDLSSKMEGRMGDSYTINGITYDDGSNISDAVKTLVRAARVERRR